MMEDGTDIMIQKDSKKKQQCLVKIGKNRLVSFTFVHLDGKSVTFKGNF